MNCHNSEQYMAEAIDCVLGQTYKHWELIIWNNMSTDGTKRIASSYLDPRVKLYNSENFTTLGEARNLALSKAKGEFIAFLDSDDIWYPQKLEIMLPRFKNHNVGICISNTYFFNTSRKKTLYTKVKPKTGKVFKNLLRSNFISLETVILRSSAVSNISFNEKYNMIEEYDYFLRLSNSCDLDYVDEILSGWRIHDNSITQKRPKLLAEELEDLLNTFENEIENFEILFSEEIKLLRSKILLLKIIYNEEYLSFSKLIHTLRTSGANISTFTQAFLISFIPYNLRLLLIKIKRRF